MKSRRPYLIRALYDWIVDSDATPFILVKAQSDAVLVPRDYVKDGQITLNIAPSAVRDLLIDDELMTFAGRFAGQSVDVCIPLSAIGAIYARESGDGMLFDTDESGSAAGSSDDVAVREVELSSADRSPAASLAYESVAGDSPDGSKAEQTAAPRRASHLKVVK